MPEFKAVIFDLDGTLINSEYFHFECWNILLSEAGVQLTYDDWLCTYAGNVLQSNARSLKEKYSLPTPLDELIKRRMALSVKRLNTQDIALMPYAAELLEFLQSRHIPMALVTSSSRPDVEAIFKRNGLAHYFKLMITKDEVTMPKPYPEGYNQCCERLGMQKQDCLVLEDSRTGLRAAKAAGLTCYAIQSNTDEHRQLQEADQLFLTLEEAKDYLLHQQLI